MSARLSRLPPHMNDSQPPGSSPKLTVAEMAELAGGLAHELRNPLSTMMVNLKLLAEQLQDKDAHFDDIRRRALLKVDVLRREAERLQALFDDFLNLTTPYHLIKQPCDLNKVVARLGEFFDPMLKTGGIQLILRIGSEPVMVQADEKFLSQALLNLVVNSQQAMPEGGTLTISTLRESSDCVIHVADTGVGIAQQDRDRILRPFFSTKARGTGLGLSITRRIVQEHGGELTLAANPPRGTVFTIRLPAA